ncbi:MAG: bacterioferritin [Terriglobales bacterium]
MKGNEKVIAELNSALSAELTAIVQYMVQAEMCNNWGYHRLGDYIKHQAFGEMHHAEGLIERILFLDGKPAVDIGLKPKIADNVKAQLEDDLVDEKDAVRQYNASIKVCVDAGDNGSRELFERMLKDEEGHTDQLEGKLQTIQDMGLANWLTQQLSGESK